MSQVPAPPKQGDRSRVIRILILVFGWLFVLLGVLGLFLPVLQGLLFLLIGLLLLSRESRWAKRRLDQLRDRFPGAAERVHEAEARIAAWARRTLGRDG